MGRRVFLLGWSRQDRVWANPVARECSDPDEHVVRIRTDYLFGKIMSARKSALNWDDPVVFLKCLDDPESIIWREFVLRVRTSTAPQILDLIEMLEEEEMLAGTPQGATIRAIERIQKAMRIGGGA